MRQLLFALPAVACVALLTGAAAPAPATAPASAQVTIGNFTFGPDSLTVAVGTTVTWINGDDVPHSVVATDKTFRSKALDTDDRFAFTFTHAGTYASFCGIHPHMVGKVVVKAP